jgi:hypothetical protein
MYGTARPIDFDIHQPNWKLASRLMRNYGAPNDSCHEAYPAKRISRITQDELSESLCEVINSLTSSSISRPG